MSFSNKIVVITGAASGIGEATAIHFAKCSAKLCLVDVDASNLKLNSEKCEKLSGNKVLFLIADLKNEEKVEEVIKRTISEFGGIDVLVNCAGIFSNGSILEPEFLKEYDNVMNINLRSVVAMTNYAAPFLVKSKGCVVNISSVAATMQHEGTLSYNIAKAGVSHFTKCVALELAPLGVRVNAIAPGLVKTNILVRAGMDQESMDAIWCTDSVPLRRLVKVEDVAELILYLSSEKASSITGVIYCIDSGMTLSRAC